MISYMSELINYQKDSSVPILFRHGTMATDYQLLYNRHRSVPRVYGAAHVSHPKINRHTVSSIDDDIPGKNDSLLTFCHRYQTMICSTRQVRLVKDNFMTIVSLAQKHHVQSCFSANTQSPWKILALQHLQIRRFQHRRAISIRILKRKF